MILENLVFEGFYFILFNFIKFIYFFKNFTRTPTGRDDAFFVCLFTHTEFALASTTQNLLTTTDVCQAVLNCNWTDPPNAFNNFVMGWRRFCSSWCRSRCHIQRHRRHRWDHVNHYSLACSIAPSVACWFHGVLHSSSCSSPHFPLNADSDWSRFVVNRDFLICVCGRCSFRIQITSHSSKDQNI